jgi:hypothetical protein
MPRDLLHIGPRLVFVLLVGLLLSDQFKIVVCSSQGMASIKITRGGQCVELKKAADLDKFSPEEVQQAVPISIGLGRKPADGKITVLDVGT